MPIKVSIIIPTYKRPELLKTCLEALVSQDFPENEFEIIIVTDARWIQISYSRAVGSKHFVTTDFNPLYHNPDF